MTLQQLRYIWEIAQHGLNVSHTAARLYTSQPGISKQLALLEEELGTSIFARSGKHLTEITDAGRQIIAVAGEVLAQVQNIKHIAQEAADETVGALTLGTTHNQARYALPPVVAAFMMRYPTVTLNIHQGTPAQVAEQAAKGIVDVAITTEVTERFSNLVLLPYYEWNRCILVQPGHPLTQQPHITLEDVAACPIVTYVSGFSGRSQMDEAFEQHHLQPQVVLAAADADVIKTYVRLGLGIGIVARMAYDPIGDSDLIALHADHLFQRSLTKIGLRRGMFIRSFVFDFIQLCAPHLTREVVEQALTLREDQKIQFSAQDERSAD